MTASGYSPSTFHGLMLQVCLLLLQMFFLSQLIRSAMSFAYWGHFFEPLSPPAMILIRPRKSNGSPIDLGVVHSHLHLATTPTVYLPALVPAHVFHVLRVHKTAAPRNPYTVALIKRMIKDAVLPQLIGIYVITNICLFFDNPLLCTTKTSRQVGGVTGTIITSFDNLILITVL